MDMSTKITTPDPEKAEMQKEKLGSRSTTDGETGLANTNAGNDKSGFSSDTEGEVDVTIVKIPLRERLHHFTFACMSTGGIALLISLLPHRFPGLTGIGTSIFLFDLLLQTIITILLLARFIVFPSSIYRAFTEPPESIFVGTFFLSLAAILANVQEYGVPKTTGTWLPTALRVCFWLYTSVTFLLSIWQYDLLFRNERHLVPSAMTPAWILPVFPVMLAGTLAGFFAPSQPEGHALAMVAAGAAAQGLGMLVSICFYGTYLARLMGYGLPDLRPGMFIAVGPPSFTAAALVSMGADIPRISLAVVSVSISATTAGVDDDDYNNNYYHDAELVGEALALACVGAAVFFWGLGLWFCLLALAGLRGMPDARFFHLGWWSFVFPNVGFAIATLRIGDAVGSEGVIWLGICMAGALAAVWAAVMVMCVRAVVRREIVWPGKDEDVPRQ